MTAFHSKLQTLIGYQVASAHLDGQVWAILFTNDSALTVECLWRLTNKGALICTSEDHLQMFGNSTFLDAASELERQTKGINVSSVTFVPGTADLRLEFGPSTVLEIISTSAGYESWHLAIPGSDELHAVAGQLRA
jgi:hypothetical protein